VGVGQRRAEARRERDREEVADVGDAEIPAEVGPLVEPSLETVVVLRDAGAGAWIRCASRSPAGLEKTSEISSKTSGNRISSAAASACRQRARATTSFG